MKREILIVAVPMALYGGWLIVAPHSAARVYDRLNPHRTHPSWLLRAGGILLLISMALILTGVLK